MALSPFFTSAPRVKLYIKDKPVAYAIGFNFNVSVTVQPVFVVGEFAPVSLEPTMYNIVTGTIQIIRLLSSSTQTAISANALKTPLNGGADQASSFAVADTTSVSGESVLLAGQTPTSNNSVLQQSELFKHVDPAQLLISETFDMHMYLKVPIDQTSVASSTLSAEQKALIASKKLEEVKWMSVRNCRITSRNTNISMGQLVNEPLNFQGLIATHATPDFSLDQVIKDKQS